MNATDDTIATIKWTRTMPAGSRGLSSTDGRFQILRIEETFFGTTYVGHLLYDGDTRVFSHGRVGSFGLREAKQIAADRVAAEKAALSTHPLTTPATDEEVAYVQGRLARLADDLGCARAADADVRAKIAELERAMPTVKPRSASVAYYAMAQALRWSLGEQVDHPALAGGI